MTWQEDVHDMNGSLGGVVVAVLYPPLKWTRGSRPSMTCRASPWRTRITCASGQVSDTCSWPPRCALTRLPGRLAGQHDEEGEGILRRYRQQGQGRTGYGLGGFPADVLPGVTVCCWWEQALRRQPVPRSRQVKSRCTAGRWLQNATPEKWKWRSWQRRAPRMSGRCGASQ